MISFMDNCYIEFIRVPGSQDSVLDPPSRVKICLLYILTLQDVT